MSWPMVALGDIFEIARGGSPRPIDAYITDDPDGVNWISIRDASNSSKYITKTEKKILPAGVSKSRLVKPGDFLLTNSMSFGRPYILQTSGCIHDGWLVLSGDKEVVDQDYFYHLLGSDLIYRKFASLAAGAVVKNLNSDLVRNVTVPLPSLPEQRRIAAILDKADALRAKRREAIAKLDQLLQSVFLEMFGDPVMNPKGWPLISFADVGQWKSGATPSKSKPAYWEGSFPWVSPKDMKVSLITDAQDHVSDLAFESTSLKRIEPGHLLIVVRGMILAHSFPTAVNAVPVAINQDMKAIAPIKGLDIVYLQAAVDSLKARILSVVSTAGHGTCRLDTRDASEVMVPVPPLEVQLAYKNIASKYTQLRGEALEQLKKLDSMFGAIQQKAFDGSL